MKISKSTFINLIRCSRYAGLFDIKYNKDKSFATFTSEEDEFEGLKNLERLDKIKALKESIMVIEGEEDNDGDDISSQDALTHKILTSYENLMQDYYNEIEILASRVIQSKFGGMQISMKYDDQKYFKTWYEDYEFYCFLDVYQEDEDTIRIFEVKSSTDTKVKNANGKRIQRFYIDEGSDTWKLYGDYDEEKMEEASTYLSQKYKSNLFNFIYDLTYQRFVVEKALEERGVTKKREYYLVLLNSEYKFDGTYKNGKPYYDDFIIRFVDLTKLTEILVDKVLINDLNMANHYLNELNASPTHVGPWCQREATRECEFYPICLSDKNYPPFDNVSIYNFVKADFGDEKLDDLINSGRVHITDVPFKQLSDEKNYIRRVAYEEATPQYVPKMIKYAMDQFKYPIYHLDFETFNAPLPRFIGERCYTQSVFQFSIHIESKPGICDQELDNVSFLASNNIDDFREDLIKLLIDTIKDDGGTVLAYNQGFEKMVIRSLYENKLFEKKYREPLEKIHGRIFDLIYLFRGNSTFYKPLDETGTKYSKMHPYYDNLMQGSFSIKKVLPALSDLTYQGLPIANGTEAIAAYSVMNKLNEEEVKQTKSNLIYYCKQDTWAMVLILDKLRKLVE